MTKPTPEALAFRAILDREQDQWPSELRQAATDLRMELDLMRTKAWKEPGSKGPEHLAKYHDLFQRLYAEWKAKG